VECPLAYRAFHTGPGPQGCAQRIDELDERFFTDAPSPHVLIGQVTDAAPPIEIVTSPCRYGEPPYIVGQSLPLLSRLLPVDAATGHHDAIALARTITRHEARRRQMQYIGRLMRDVDPEPLHAALAAWARGSQAERAQFALVESWRDRMLQESDGINAFADAYPGAPRESLASLAAAARDERARGAPPHKSRELFRALKRIIEGTPR